MADGVPCDAKECPHAGQGFLNQHEGKVGILVAVLGRLMGAGYHEATAADARRRIVEFFDHYLKASP